MCYHVLPTTFSEIYLRIFAAYFKLEYALSECVNAYSG